MSGLVVDGCAGPGGFDLGARAVGFDPVGFEWDADACATRAAAGLRTVRADVTQVATGPLAGRLDGLLFSPPCVSFSTAGKRGGERDKPLIYRALADLAQGCDTRAELTARATDPRSLVVAEPLRFALDCRPRWTVWEQVPPVLGIWEACAHHLREAGYSVWTGLLNSANFGVPQTRLRAFLLARLDGSASPPPPTHCRDLGGQVDMFGPGLEPWVSMAEALGLDGVDRPARTVAGNRAPRWAYGAGATSYGTGWTLHTNRDQRPDGSRQTIAAARPAPSLTGKSGGQWVMRTEQTSDTARGRVPIERCGDEPAPTLVANADRWELRVGDQVNATVRASAEPAPTLFFGHQKNEVRWRLRNNTQPNSATRDLDEPQSGQDSVRITVEQAAVLQSLPGNYPFQGTKTARFSQVGNAVPPLLAAHCIAAASGRPFEFGGGQ